VVVIDPEGLDGELEVMVERPMVAAAGEPGVSADAAEGPWSSFGEFERLVRRNDRAVRHVLIGGREAWSNGRLMADLGRRRGFGSVLRVG
jgi:hypothetical protein